MSTKGQIMGFLSKIKNTIKGAKTYLLMIASIIGATVAFGDGGIDVVEYVKAVITAAGFMTLRAGVGSKS